MSLRLARAFTALFIFLLAFSPRNARAEIIRSFDSVVRANKDASLDVTETIVYDFEGASKHGIERIIPVSYNRRDGAYNVQWSVESVSDENGAPYRFEKTKSGRDLVLRIGDPNVLISGVHTYKIVMRFVGAVNFCSWLARILLECNRQRMARADSSSHGAVLSPPGTKISQLRIRSFQGPQGSTQPAQQQKERDSVVFSASNLPPGSGLTFVVGNDPKSAQKLLWFIADWWSAFTFPLLALVGMFFLWRAKGRDIEGGLPAQVEWSPPKDLTPADVGTLLDERCDMTDILSTLIDLAARGYIIIEDLSTKGAVLGIGAKADYAFTRTNQQIPIDAPLRQHETTFLQGLFGTTAPGGQRVTLSSLKNQFYMYLPQIRQAVYRDLTDKKLFQSNPETTRNDYIGYGVVIAGLGVLAFFAAGFLGSIAYGIGLVGAGIIVALFSSAMPAKTALGSRRLRECVGFQRFVQLAEKDRIEKLISDDPTIFGRLLPYAMVLGVGEVWATKFAGLMQQAPDWYYSNNNDMFVPALFVSNLGSGMNQMGTTFSSQPTQSSGAGGGSSGFGGGGFSGGGFGGGGGGGGSW